MNQVPNDMLDVIARVATALRAGSMSPSAAANVLENVHSQATPKQLTDEPRVLIADDDEMSAAVARHRLERAGYTVEVVADGEKARSWALRHPRPQVVVAAINLPILDGFDLLSSLIPDGPPVILLGRPGNDQSVARAMDSGAADFLLKPFSSVELIARVKRAANPGSRWSV